MMFSFSYDYLFFVYPVSCFSSELAIRNFPRSNQSQSLFVISSDDRFFQYLRTHVHEKAERHVEIAHEKERLALKI